MRAHPSPPERVNPGRPWTILLALAAVVVACAVLVIVALAPAGDARPPDRETAARPEARVHLADRGEEIATPPAPENGSAARERRDRVREKILRALSQTAERRGDARDDADGSSSARVPNPRSDDEGIGDRPGGELRDRIGGREALVSALSDDFMPLADECIAAARERDPSLAGMLAIELEVIADEQIGAVVETVGFPEQNEVGDPLLQECIRETSLSSILPPPPAGGREGFMLTMPIEAID